MRYAHIRMMFYATRRIIFFMNLELLAGFLTKWDFNFFNLIYNDASSDLIPLFGKHSF